MDRMMNSPDRFWSDWDLGSAQAARVSAPRAATKGASSSSADPVSSRFQYIRDGHAPSGRMEASRKPSPPVHGAAHRLPES